MAEGSVGRISRHGLSLVYAPPSEGRAVAHIIFIHGLFGHPEKTWTGPNPPDATGTDPAEDGTTPRSSGIFWPARLLPTTVQNTNVHTWGYDADIDAFWSCANQNTVAQHAANLLSDLADLLESDESNVLPIIFIVHSLGGIVLKAALNQSSETKATRLSMIVDKVHGIIFLGTPHRGSASASIGKHAYRVTRIATKRPNLKLLRALERNSDSLDGIGNSFLQTVAGHKNIQVYSFREEEETRRWAFFSTVVVEPDSAKIGLANEEVNSIPANHSNMTKFSLPTDIGFKRVVAQLKRWVKSIEVENSVIIDDCVRSLQSTQTQLRFDTVTSSHAKTSHWLYDPNEVSFSKWLEDSENDLGSIYWIQGKPGSGKSTLMKFAMLDPRTRELLKKSDGTPYLLAGYFFHDRGKLIQKSIQGMLQALLFSILSQTFALRQFVQPFYTKLISLQNTKLVAWDFDSLKNAFEAIAKQREVKTRLCLFLDALDEHHGDNDRLSDMMHHIAAFADGDVVKVRLCLASRPWDTFVTSFGDCPGFKIHNHTLKDIEAYTSSQLHNALAKLPGCGPAENEKAHKLHDLADKVSRKAQGVFIWVRIVVEQIATAVRERTPFIALQTMLDDMPTELKDLYYHTLQRIDSRHAEESYIMFQIAWCTLTPLALESFVNATSWALWRKVPKPGDERLEDMAQRVVSRSGGLLEVIHVERSSLLDQIGGEDELPDENLAFEPVLLEFKRPRTHIVQFCHQTAKEYIQGAKGNFGLQRSRTDGNGHQYLLAAAVPSPNGWGKHMADEAFEYAALARKGERITSLEYIYDTLKQLFEAVNISEWVRRKNLHFYNEPIIFAGTYIRCLAFAAGLDIVTADSFPRDSFWLTALLGPPTTSTKIPRRDMLQNLWDVYRPASVSAIRVPLSWMGAEFVLQALEAMVFAKLISLEDGGDRFPAIDFLLSHGADPNMELSGQAMTLLKKLRLDDSAPTLFMACIKWESAPIIKLFGKYGARVPKEYCGPLRTMRYITTYGGSQVFEEVMRIVKLGEQELVGDSERDNMGNIEEHPFEKIQDDFQVGILLPSIGAIATGRVLVVRKKWNPFATFGDIVLLVCTLRRLARTWYARACR